MSLTFSELRKANVERCRAVWRHEEDWSPSDWMVAVMTELGEASEVIADLRRNYSVGMVPQGDKALADELADVVSYLDLLAARCGIDLGEAISKKFNEVSDRVGSQIKLPLTIYVEHEHTPLKHPVDYTKGF